MEKRQFRVLYREFLFRMVDLELLSAHAQGDISKLLGQFGALLVFVSVLLGIAGALSIGDGVPGIGELIGLWTTQHFLVATTMLVVGLFAVLSWDSTFPNRRDVLVLAPLPLRTRTLFLAKIAAVATALALTVAALHIVAGLVWPFAFARAGSEGAPALTFDAPMPPATAATLPDMLKRDLRQPLWPGEGLVVGISEHGRRRVVTYGTAKPDSIFEIGSISKAFTGLLLARMAEEGRTSLDEPVRTLLPAGTVRKPDGLEITLLDLATQHSGLPRMPDNFHPADMTNPLVDYHARDLYAFLAQHGVARPAGASYLYSNLGFAVLGQALAERAETTWPALLENQIARPLGMKDTAVALSPEQQARLIQGHSAAHRPVHEWNMDVFAGAGGIRSTAGDMLTFLDAQLHPAGPLRAAVVQSQRVRAGVGAGTRIALAWHYTENNGTFWASGGTGGFNSYAFFNPRGDYAGVVLLNMTPTLIPFADFLGMHLRQRLAGEPAISLDTVAVPGNGGALGVLRSFGAYWISMLAAGAFIYCFVLGLQGVLAQFLPRAWYLRASSFLQLAVFSLFVCGFFLLPSPIYALFVAPDRPWLAWIPTYWFVGMFQQLNGSLHPALSPLAWRAWTGLAVVAGVAAFAYALSYLRTVRRIVEEPDIAPASRRLTWLPRFRNPLQTAIVQFSIRTLARSRQHRVLFAFYLGIGFALTILFLNRTPLARAISGEASDTPLTDVSSPVLAASLLLMAFAVFGARVVFSMPLELRSNWIFRVLPIAGGRDLMAARRRALLALSAGPVWALWAVVLLALWPWRPALGHLAILGLIGLILAELFLGTNMKIPFTCSWLPGKSNVYLMFWVCVWCILLVTAWGAVLEKRALVGNGAAWATSVGVLIAILILARWRTTVHARSEGAELQFEEAPPPAVQQLGLHRDGVLALEPADRPYRPS